MIVHSANSNNKQLNFDVTELYQLASYSTLFDNYKD